MSLVAEENYRYRKVAYQCPLRVSGKAQVYDTLDRYVLYPVAGFSVWT
jgi:hypothetical protein